MRTRRGGRRGKAGIAVVCNRRSYRSWLKRGVALLLGAALLSTIALSALMAQPPPIVQVPTLPVQIEPKTAPLPSAPSQPPGPPSVPPPPVFTPPPPAVVPPPVEVGPPKAATKISIKPRFQTGLKADTKPDKDGFNAIIVDGGVSVFIMVPAKSPTTKATYLDIEADRLVIWTKGNGPQVFDNMKGPQGDEGDAHELYMVGHVEIRTRGKAGTQTLQANEVYYDVRRSVMVARKANLELMNVKLPNPINVVAPELIQENAQTYKVPKARIFDSILPSDPGLYVDVSDLTIEEKKVPRTYLYGLYVPKDADGKQLVEDQRTFKAWNMITSIEGVPIGYFPYLRGRVEDPLGPLEGLGMGYNTYFGFMINTTWDMYDLLDLPKVDGTRWRLFLDYLTMRGPGIGSDFDFSGKDLFGTKATYTGQLKLYGIFDRGIDDLGGNRGVEEFWPNANTTWPVTQPDFRGWATGKVNVQNLPDGFSVMGQYAFVSDRNFVEQYYPNSQLNDPNLDTFVQVKQQQDNWAWTLYSQISTRDWVTETNWFPKADAYLLGQTFSFDQFEDLLVYNAQFQAGYAQLLPTQQVPFAYSPTDVRRDVGRFDLLQDVSMPFYVGPIKVVPYLVGDVAYYSQDINGDQQGRLYGGGGIRWNLPFSRLFPDIKSELFNINGIYHKINFVGNYFASQSSVSSNILPQLDRFNDDATDQALRDIRPVQTLYTPGSATYLTTSPLFDPQNYALRRLISTTDSLDTMNVAQLGIDQRWQTKRGAPGDEHVVDWMTLNVGISVFPHSERDNFGHTFGIFQYDWTWNIGDRTALTSSGWFEPQQGGPDAWDFGMVTGRPDATNFYLGYRQIDPVQSKAVVASIVYPFSAKYAVSANTVWDFGDHVTTYSIFLARMGTDVLFNFGLSYNSTLSTISVALEIVPNLARRASRAGAYFPTAASDIDPTIPNR